MMPGFRKPPPLYRPPEGFYDLPFTWVFDANGLVDGGSYPNQYIYLQGGYGDFILRRVVGLDRILNAGTGTFRIRDRFNVPIQSDPVFAARTPDLPFAPEKFYAELGAIRMDLYNVSTAVNPFQNQIAFQGVRRMKGQQPQRPSFQSNPKYFAYQATVPLLQTVPAPAVRVFVPIEDFDFELYQIVLLQRNSATWVVPEECFIVYANPDPSLQGQQMSFEILNTGIPFQAFSISLASTAATVTPQTDAGGNIITTCAQLIAAWSSNPALTALATLVPKPPAGLITSAGPIFLPLGSGASPLTIPICSIWLYDQDRVQVASAPVLDIYMQGLPGTALENGALVPPLYYRKNSQIQLDVYNLTANPTAVGIVLVGRQHIPC